MKSGHGSEGLDTYPRIWISTKSYGSGTLTGGALIFFYVERGYTLMKFILFLANIKLTIKAKG
jgi:hypothetical protein